MKKSETYYRPLDIPFSDWYTSYTNHTIPTFEVSKFMETFNTKILKDESGRLTYELGKF